MPETDEIEPSPPRKFSRPVWLLVLLVASIAVCGLAYYRFWRDPIVYGTTDWPWWRGPDQSGRVAEAVPDTALDLDNLLWKTAIPGRGHGSPIIHSDRIFLASADESEKTLSLYCYGRSDGAQRWATVLQRGGLMHKSIKNTYASASAATDGSRVYYPWIAENAVWLAAIDFSGEIVWSKPFAPYSSEHGYASSPCLYQDLVIVAGDNLGASYLTAARRRDGEIIWQQPRSRGGSYGTPVIAHVAGRDQLLLSGQNSVVSYDPASGEELWRCAGPGESTIGTVTWKDELVFATCGAPPMTAGAIAIRGDTGEIQWRADVMANVPSALVIGDKLLITEDRGTIQLLEADTGEVLWKERLGGNFSASPALAGGRIFLPNEAGELFVFTVDNGFELQRELDFEDGIFASPVIAGGQLIVRTVDHLYCIGKSDSR